MEPLLIITNVGEHLVIMPSEHLLSLKEDERTERLEYALRALRSNDNSCFSVAFDQRTSSEEYARICNFWEEVSYDVVEGFIIGFKSGILPIKSYLDPEIPEFLH